MERLLYVSSLAALDEFPIVVGVDGWPVAAGAGFALLLAGNFSGAGAAVIRDTERWCIENRLFAVSVGGRL
jgi:hypothetical protein